MSNLRHDDVRPVFQCLRVDSNNRPPARFEFGRSIDSVAARRVIPLTCAVKFDADFAFRPAHADPGRHRAPIVEYLDLGLGRWQARSNDQQANSRLIGRIGAGVDQW